MLRDAGTMPKVIHIMNIFFTPCACAAQVVGVSSLDLVLLVGILETK
jgi:hypothetical protein